MKIFRLSYFFLPYSNTASPALATLKQCLHYDPDSKQCLPAHRLVKSFDKTFKSLELALSEENWTHVIQILVGGSPETGFVFKFDDALSIHTSTKVLPMPAGLPPLSPRKTSPKRELILRSLCKAYTNTKDFRKAESWCDDLLRMDGLENDVDGLIGKGETLLKKEEWEDAVRIFEKAFEASGRSSRDVSGSLGLHYLFLCTHGVGFRHTNGFRKHKSFSNNPGRRTTIKCWGYPATRTLRQSRGHCECCLHPGLGHHLLDSSLPAAKLQCLHTLTKVVVKPKWHL